MNETTTKSHANTIKKTSKGAKVLAILSALLLVFGAFLWSSSIWLVNNWIVTDSAVLGWLSGLA